MWFVGVICSLLACLGTVTGMMLQKYSHMTEDRKPPEKRRSEVKRPLWWLSLVFMIAVPAPLDFAALSFASLSILGPLAGVTLLLNVILSPIFLKEKLACNDIIGTVLICIGAGITTAFGSRDEKHYDVAGFHALYQRPIFIAFFVLVNIVLVTLILVVKFMKNGRRVATTPNENWLIPFLPHLLGCLTGLAGAEQMALSKSIVEITSVSVKANDGGKQFTYPLTYAIICFGVALAILQIKSLNTGLSLYDVVYFLPIYNSYLIVWNIVVGLIYFDEIATLTDLQVGMFFLGTVVVVAGVLLLKKQDKFEYAPIADLDVEEQTSVDDKKEDNKQEEGS